MTERQPRLDDDTDPETLDDWPYRRSGETGDAYVRRMLTLARRNLGQETAR